MSSTTIGLQQEAQLSQSDRVTLRVVEYFAKSLTQGHSKGVSKFLLVFHWNYVCISYRYWDIQRQRMA